MNTPYPGFPQQNPYQQYPYQGYPSPQPPVSGMAVASMICGIVGLLICWIPFFGLPLPLVGGILAGISAGPTGRGEQSGKGFSIAGLVTSIIGGVIALLILAYALSSPLTW